MSSTMTGIIRQRTGCLQSRTLACFTLRRTVKVSVPPLARSLSPMGVRPHDIHVRLENTSLNSGFYIIRKGIKEGRSRTYHPNKWFNPCPLTRIRPVLYVLSQTRHGTCRIFGRDWLTCGAIKRSPRVDPPDTSPSQVRRTRMILVIPKQ